MEYLKIIITVKEYMNNKIRLFCISFDISIFG